MPHPPPCRTGSCPEFSNVARNPDSESVEVEAAFYRRIAWFVFRFHAKSRVKDPAQRGALLKAASVRGQRISPRRLAGIVDLRQHKCSVKASRLPDRLQINEVEGAGEVGHCG